MDCASKPPFLLLYLMNILKNSEFIIFYVIKIILINIFKIIEIHAIKYNLIFSWWTFPHSVLSGFSSASGFFSSVLVYSFASFSLTSFFYSLTSCFGYFVSGFFSTWPSSLVSSFLLDFFFPFCSFWPFCLLPPLVLWSLLLSVGTSNLTFPS